MRDRTQTFPVIVQAIVLYGLFGVGVAYAQDVSDIVTNMEASSSALPGLLTASAYLLGLLLGVLAILKLKAHVDYPQQTPLRESLVRFAAGGALFALPMIYEAMKNTIDAGGGGGFSQMGMASGLFGMIAFGGNFNDILRTIITSLQNVPGLISGVGYLLGLLLGVSGILKLKEHVDSPQNVPLREPMIRFVIGGALFALPVMFKAMQETISDGSSFLPSLIDAIFSFIGLGTNCSVTSLVGGLLGGFGGLFGGLFGGGDTVGDAICQATIAAQALPAFLNAMAYLFGLILGVWGLMKLKDHVLNPQQVSIWEPVARLIAGGAFFSLPYLINVARSSVTSMTMFGFLNTGFSGATSGSGLDAMMVNFMANIYGPTQFAVNFFCYVGGIIFLMIGVSRLIKSANEGPRGPGGIGTLMTFLTGALLISLSPIIGAFSSSFFGDFVTETNANLVYTTGMTATEVAHVHAVISAILQFMILLGIISVARGIFIIRGVAEGNSQASMMAGITHILGGALAINLGPVMNAVQTTLGLGAYGVNFS